MENLQSKIQDYLKKYADYCASAGCRDLDFAMDVARRVLEPEGLFQDTPLPLESAGIPIGISLEDIARTVFAASKKSKIF